MILIPSNSNGRSPVIFRSSRDRFSFGPPQPMPILKRTNNSSLGNCFSLVIISSNIPEKQGEVFRYGGEEFLVIIVNITREEVLIEAERIRLLTEKLEMHTLDNIPFTISVSQGISMLRSDETINDAIKRADERLYIAKRKGRNCVVATT